MQGLAVLQFVTGIGGSLVLDLNAGPRSVLKDGFDFSPAEYTRQESRSLMRDGVTYTAAAKDNRFLNFRMLLKAPASAVAAHVAAMDAVLDDTRAWLKYQAHPDTAAVTFHTWRCSYRREVEEWALGIHIFAFSIPADPMGYA